MTMNLPRVAIVGRPNVGKSTLFNWLTKSRRALVCATPGVTRDRQYGLVQIGERLLELIDTGGIFEGAREEIERITVREVERALAEADLVLFVVDAQTGRTADDEAIAVKLRRYGKPVVVVVNKIDGVHPDGALAEFAPLGFREMVLVSAKRRMGGKGLREAILADLPPAAEGRPGAVVEPPELKIAILGRPNVGKSTLVNRLLGQERVIVCDLPGTTRDAVEIPFERGGHRYLLIDTAGVRRRARISETVEKFSVAKAFEAVERADAVIYLVDATEGVTEQDARLVGQVIKRGKPLLIAYNKWDLLSPEQRRERRREHGRRLAFAGFAPVVELSAFKGMGVEHLLDRVRKLADEARREFPTSRLCKILEEAVGHYQPPQVGGRRIKLKFAHMSGTAPPEITVWGTKVDALPENYKRYLVRVFREALRLEGVPLRLVFKQQENPFRTGPKSS